MEHVPLARGLKATGGSLSLKNCSWGLLSFYRKGNCWLLHNDISAPEVLYTLNKSSLLTLICHIHPQDDVEVVGITQSLMGDSSLALKVLLAKANSWQEILKPNFLLHSLLWWTVFHGLWPLLRFSLGVSSFSPIQASQVISQLYQTLLPQLGVN